MNEGHTDTSARKQSELDQEQTMVDLDQSIAEREQARADSDQQRIDEAQEQLDLEAPALSQGSPHTKASIDQRQVELNLAQDRSDAHQTQLDDGQRAQDVRRDVLDDQQAPLDQPSPSTPVNTTAEQAQPGPPATEPSVFVPKQRLPGLSKPRAVPRKPSAASKRPNAEKPTSPPTPPPKPAEVANLILSGEAIPVARAVPAGEDLTLEGAPLRLIDPRSGDPAALVAAALDAALKARAPGAQASTDLVVRLVSRVGRELELDDQTRGLLEVAARVRDIGMIALPDSVVLATWRLSPDDWALINSHPVLGAQLLEELDPMVSAAPIVRAHHERWDGNGYPDGLSGNAIPLLSRVIATCDAFVAIASDRPHRRGMGAAAALDLLRQESGAQFDPAAVDALISCLATDAGRQACTSRQHDRGRDAAECQARYRRPGSRTQTRSPRVRCRAGLGPGCGATALVD